MHAMLDFEHWIVGAWRAVARQSHAGRLALRWFLIVVALLIATLALAQDQNTDRTNPPRTENDQAAETLVLKVQPDTGDANNATEFLQGILSGALSGLLAVISGVIVALFAFYLSKKQVVDRRKQQDGSVLKCAIVEIEVLFKVLSNNQKLIETELESFAKKQGALVNPFDPPLSGFWDLIKTHTPDVLLDDEQLLANAAAAARDSEQVAQLIRSRESYHISNRAMSNFAKEIEAYDTLLMKFVPDLITNLHTLKDDLDALVSKLEE